MEDGYIVVKKSRLEDAVAKWNKILDRKQKSPEGGRGEGGGKGGGGWNRDGKGGGGGWRNGVVARNGEEEPKRKVPFYKKISGIVSGFLIIQSFPKQ